MSFIQANTVQTASMMRAFSALIFMHFYAGKNRLFGVCKQAGRVFNTDADHLLHGALFFPNKLKSETSMKRQLRDTY